MVNLLPNRIDYYTQNNNERDPRNACQRTAAAQCLYILGEIDKIKGPYAQPEDNLDYICNTDPEIFDFCFRSHGREGIPPAKNCPVDNIIEWADVLCFTIEKAVGYTAARYSEYGFVSIVADLEAGLPLMASMKYPERNVPGHYVSVVGYGDGGREIIVADPYRNSLSGGPDGFGNVYTAMEWAKYFKGYGIRFRRRRIV